MVTNWVNDPKRGESTWLAGQLGINAGSIFDDTYNLEVLAGQLGLSTAWDNQLPETINN